jgi:hypothetical protein
MVMISPNTKVIDTLIKSAQTEFGTHNLFGGNCGEFAWALAQHLNRRSNFKAKLAFLTNKHDDEGQEIDNPRGADIYHVVITVG